MPAVAIRASAAAPTPNFLAFPKNISLSISREEAGGRKVPPGAQSRHVGGVSSYNPSKKFWTIWNCLSIVGSLLTITKRPSGPTSQLRA